MLDLDVWRKMVNGILESLPSRLAFWSRGSLARLQQSLRLTEILNWRVSHEHGRDRI